MPSFNARFAFLLLDLRTADSHLEELDGRSNVDIVCWDLDPTVGNRYDEWGSLGIQYRP